MKNAFIIIAAVVILLVNVQAFAADVKSDAKASDTPVAVGVVKVPDTLMFSPEELADIQSHIGEADSDGSARGAVNAIENASLYLSTILYFGPADWTIWVNGVPVGPKQDFQAFKVTDITPSSVELLVPLSALGMRPVRLGPNQTFVTKSGIVVEGRVQ